MAEFAPVLPLSVAPLLSKKGLLMLQAHLFEPLPSNLRWFQDQAYRIILDNGAAEGKADVGMLYKMAELLHPSEVVCPDALRDMDKTLKLFHAHALDLSKYAERVMIVPQGNTVVEWVECLQKMMTSREWDELPRITIGIPKVLDSFPGGRSSVMAWMDDNALVHDVYFHLLGQQRDVGQVVRLLNYFPYIRSWDSTWPYACALRNILCHDGAPKIVLTDEEWNPQDYVPSSVMKMAEINIAICRRAAYMAASEGESMGHG